MSGQFLSGLALSLILVEIRLRCRRRKPYTAARAAAVGFSFEISCVAVPIAGATWLARPGFFEGKNSVHNRPIGVANVATLGKRRGLSPPLNLG